MKTNTDHRPKPIHQHTLPLLFGAAFISHLHFFGAVSVPFMRDWVELSYTKMFLLQAWFAFWLFVLEIPTGVIADRWGKRISMQLSMIMGASGQILFSQFQAFEMLMLGEFLFAVGLALLSGANVALVYDVAKEQGKDTQKALIWQRSFSVAGMVCGFTGGAGFAVSGWIPYPESLPFTFAMTAFMQLVACGLLFAVADPPGRPLEGSALRQGWEGLLCVFQRPSLRPFALNLAAIGATSFFIFWFYQPKLQEMGLSVAVNGWVAAGMNLSSFAILGRIVWLQGKLGLRRLVLLTAILPGLGFLIMASSLNPVIVICAILLVGACKIAREPVMQNLANARIESERRATVLSAISMLTRIVVFLMYPVVGFLADRSLALVLVFLGFATLTAAVATQLRAAHLGIEEKKPVPDFGNTMA